MVPPVTAERSPPALADDGRGLAGDGRLVDRGDAFDDLAVAGDELAGLDQHDVAGRSCERRHRLDVARRAVGSASRLAGRLVRVPRSASACALPAPFGDRLGEIGEQHREPQPGGDLAGERRRLRRYEIADEQHGDERRHDGGDEDHRVA